MANHHHSPDWPDRRANAIELTQGLARGRAVSWQACGKARIRTISGLNGSYSPANEVKLCYYK